MIDKYQGYILKKNNRFNLCGLFFVLLFVEYFLPAIISFGTNAIVLSCFILKYKFRGLVPFGGIKYLYFILFFGLVIGMLGLIIKRYELRDYIRDIYYFTNPVLVILNGAYIKKRYCDDKSFFNTIIVVSGIHSVYYLIKALREFAMYGSSISFLDWRIVIGDSSAIAATTIVLIIIDNGDLLSIGKSIKKLILVLCFLEIIISLSRTKTILIIVSLTIIAVQRGAIKRIKGIVKYSFIFGSIIIMALVFGGKMNAVVTFVEKLNNSLTEIDSSLEWSNSSVIQHNWRGYETHCALVQYGDYSFPQKLCGCGFGERVEVGIYADRLLNIKDSSGAIATSIPVLHNGYATMLCKLGILGIVLYLLFYASMIRIGRKNKKKGIHSELLVAVIVSLCIETYYLNGLFRDGINYPYVYLIGYLGLSICSKEQE